MSDIQATASAPPTYPLQRKLEVGPTARATWRVYRRQPWRFVWLIIIPILVSAAFNGLQFAVQKGEGKSGTIVLVVGIVGFFAQYGTQFVCQGASLYGSARNMEGAYFKITEAMGVGFSRLLSFVGVFILVTIMVLVALVIVLIPGIIASVFLSLAVPACVLERRGPISAIQRSFDLVKGNWWRTFAAYLLAVFVPLLAILAVGGAIYAILAAVGAKTLLTLIVLVPFGLVAFLVLAAVGTLMPGVVFVELRRAKEGGGPSAIVSGVFD